MNQTDIERKRINELLIILNATAIELKRIVPETEEEFKKFRESIDFHYWKNNQLSLF